MLATALLVLVIHGGAWYGSPQVPANPTQIPEAAQISYWGNKVQYVDYRSGLDSLPDVIHTYDAAKATWKGPICAIGSSAGGNLALLLAEKRKLTCVISQSGPTDLIRTNTYLEAPVSVWFTTPALRTAYSPATRPLKVPALNTESTNDGLVPPAQGQGVTATHFVFQAPTPFLVACTPSDTFFVHSCVPTSRYKQYLLVLHSFLNKWTKSGLRLGAHSPRNPIPVMNRIPFSSYDQQAERIFGVIGENVLTRYGAVTPVHDQLVQQGPEVSL